MAIECADAIKEIAPSANVEATLVRFLESDNCDHRERAIIALRRHGAAAAKRSLAAAFERETDMTMKDDLAVTIAEIDQRISPQGVTP